MSKLNQLVYERIERDSKTKNYLDEFTEEVVYRLDEFLYDRVDEFLELEEEEIIPWLAQLNDNGGITETEIIYYNKAIKFLTDNDPSLKDSLALAEELGYKVDDINSELLASLLLSDMQLTAFHRYLETLDKFIQDNKE